MYRDLSMYVDRVRTFDSLLMMAEEEAGRGVAAEQDGEALQRAASVTEGMGGSVVEEGGVVASNSLNATSQVSPSAPQGGTSSSSSPSSSFAAPAATAAHTTVYLRALKRWQARFNALFNEIEKYVTISLFFFLFFLFLSRFLFGFFCFSRLFVFVF